MFTWTLTDNDTGEIQVLTKQGQKADPRGWEDVVLRHERSEKYHGIFYTAANEFQFYCKGGGKELVDNAYDLKGQEANVSITLDVQCDGNIKRIFTGKLNFSEYKQEWIAGKLYTILDAKNDDIRLLINTREEMKVNLLEQQSLSGVPLNNYPYLGYEVNMHSRVVHIESQWDVEPHNCCFRFVTTGLKELYVLPNMDLLQGDFQQSTAQESRCEFDNTFNGFLEDAGFIVNTVNSPVFVQPNTVRISWNISGQATFNTFDVSIPDTICIDASCGTNTPNQKLYDSGDARLRVFFGNDKNNSVGEAANCGADPINENGEIKFIDLVQFNFIGTSSPDIFNFSGSGTRDIILNPGDKIWFYWVMDMNFLSSDGDMTINFSYANNDLTIYSDTIFRSTTCTSIAIHEAWSRLSEIITDQPTAFYSEFFGRTNSNIAYPSDGCGSRVAITNGLNIRTIQSSIPTSLKDMFDSCNAIYAIGMGISRYNGIQVIQVEPVHYFYPTNIILKLENVPNIRMSHLTNKVYNQVTLGFQKWNTQNVNGLDEPLTKIEYTIPPIKQSKNKFEAISSYVAGMYAIELTRRVTEVTKDTQYDEDVFLIALRKDDMTIPEKDENFSNVNGLLSPETAYNLRFLLSSTFDRVKYMFTSGLTKLGTLANPVLMPAEGEGNEDVTYTFIPDGCDGDHKGTQQSNGRAGRYPHAQARREDPLWLPEEFTFDYPMEFSQYVNLVDNPLGMEGLVEFSDGNDNFYYGWIVSIEYRLKSKMASFTLIRKYG